MAFELDIPVIETERLILRGFEHRDFDAVYAYKSDPDVMNFTGGAETIGQAWKSLSAMAGSWILNGFGYLCVADRHTDECLGHIGLIKPPEWPDYEVGYTFAKASQGRGYATEAATAALKYAYQKLGWKTAISLIDKKNNASQGVVQRMGAHKGKNEV